MFGLFKSKLSIDDIELPLEKWNIQKEDSTAKHWINEEQTVALSLNYFGIKPDIPTMINVDELRQFYRDQLVAVNGGIVEVELIEIQQIPVIRTIFKIPQQPTGITYLGSLTIPFKQASYVVKLQAPEIAMTGMRESIILDQWLKEQPHNGTEGTDALEGWAQDPYDADWKEGTRYTIAEHRKYDLKFPTHPLSLTRKLLAELEQELKFNERMMKAERFSL